MGIDITFAMGNERDMEVLRDRLNLECVKTHNIGWFLPMLHFNDEGVFFKSSKGLYCLIGKVLEENMVEEKISAHLKGIDIFFGQTSESAEYSIISRWHDGKELWALVYDEEISDRGEMPEAYLQMMQLPEINDLSPRALVSRFTFELTGFDYERGDKGVEVQELKRKKAK